MKFLNNIWNYVRNTNWTSIITYIATGSILQIGRLKLYRGMTEYISSVPQNSYYSIYTLFTFFAQLLLVHLFQNKIGLEVEVMIYKRITELFNKIIERIMHYKLSFFGKDINVKISQLWSYLNSFESLIFKIFLDLPKISTYLIYYLYTIYNFSPKAVVLIIPVNILILYILHPYSKKQYKLQKEKIELDVDTRNKLLESTSNIEFVKLNNKEDYEINKIQAAYETYRANKVADRQISFILTCFSEIFSDFLIVIIYSIGITLLIDNKLKPIDLLYLATHTGNFYYQCSQLKDIYNFYKKIYPKLDIIDEMLNYEIETHQNKEIETLSNDKNIPTISEINFNHVTFSYDGHKDIFNDVSFVFNGHKINLLLGPNGSGKSTLIKLLLKLYDLKNGNILINKNFDIKNVDNTSLRKKITLVTQDPSLFNDTVWYNIKYGDENVPDENIYKACELLDSTVWVNDNKNKSVGFRGKNLSGGEKKKVQLINSICKDSDVIIFDEPTNTLDSSAFKWFTEFITVLKNKLNKTIIIITHDLRLLEFSDHTIDLNLNTNNTKN